MDERDPRGFLSYGLSEAEVDELGRWARSWEADIRARLASGEAGPTGAVESEWDSYFDSR